MSYIETLDFVALHEYLRLKVKDPDMSYYSSPIGFGDTTIRKILATYLLNHVKVEPWGDDQNCEKLLKIIFDIGMVKKSRVLFMYEVSNLQP